MLCLSRRKGETLTIGPDITVTVVRIGPNQVRLGIDAPRGYTILRSELPEPPQRKQPESEAARAS